MTREVKRPQGGIRERIKGPTRMQTKIKEGKGGIIMEREETTKSQRIGGLEKKKTMGEKNQKRKERGKRTIVMEMKKIMRENFVNKKPDKKPSKENEEKI